MLDKKEIFQENRRKERARKTLRPHHPVSDFRFAHLTTRLYGSPTPTQLQEEESLWLSAKQAQEDLDELENDLFLYFAYLKLRNIDYQAALDTIRNELQAGIHIADFGFQIRKFLALFGDGHTRANLSRIAKHADLPDISLPFLLQEVAGKAVALSKIRQLYHPDSFTLFFNQTSCHQYCCSQN